MVNVLGINIGRRRISDAQKVEDGINAMVEGILMAVDYIAANGQNVTAPLQVAYGNVTANPATNYDARPAVVMENNTNVYNPNTDPVVIRAPRPRSAFSKNAFATARQATKQNIQQQVDALDTEWGNLETTLEQITNEANLKAMGRQQAMQTVQRLVGTLNTTGNMRTTFSPAELYESVRRFASFVELMTPQPAAGALVVPNAVLEGLRQRLATNQFMAQRTQLVDYQLPVQTAATVMLAQYAIR
ncbi:hypothetical protein HYU16_03115 [Candidatus Woesearchaeota archaeon]|nr:hypothetical protein [Candidatus Woesearchaeota archaeon]